MGIVGGVLFVAEEFGEGKIEVDGIFLEGTDGVVDGDYG